MLRMLHDMMYTIPNERLISTLTRVHHNAAVLVNGSFSASWI